MRVGPSISAIRRGYQTTGHDDDSKGIVGSETGKGLARTRSCNASKDDCKGTTEDVSKVKITDVKTAGESVSRDECRQDPVDWAARHPALRWRESMRGDCTEDGNLCADRQASCVVTGEVTSGRATRTSVRMQHTGTEHSVVATTRRNVRRAKGVRNSVLHVVPTAERSGGGARV